MISKRKWALIISITLSLVILDQVTKWMAIQWLQGRPSIVLLGDTFRFTFATNRGAFLSLGHQLPKWVLTSLNAVILIALCIFLFYRRELTTWISVSLALILSGGIGNLIDRVFRGGEVIDFMNMGVPNASSPFLRTGVFNIADMAIMAGLFLMIGLELFGHHKDKDGETSEE